MLPKQIHIHILIALKRFEIFDDCRKCLLKVPDGNVRKLRSRETKYAEFSAFKCNGTSHK